jgi:UDP-2,4-diacetamido-2,4,6-trideoxy-beta-L-altropyranose hydrolase
MDIALRTDASQAIGMGHFKRCLSLAQALKARGARCRFVMRKLGVDVWPKLAAEGIELTLLPARGEFAGYSASAAEPGPALAHAAWAEVSQAQDAAETLAALLDRRPAWLLVDHYALDARWHVPVATGLICRIAAIDDLADRDLAVDLLVDHNHSADHRAKYGRHLPSGAAILGGPRHALLSPRYASAPRHRPDTRVESIGIFMGGVDAADASELALAACDAAGFGGPVEIATTSTNPHLTGLHAAVARRPRTTLLLDQPDLATFFARHGLQIGAGGGATWERCCIGVPTLALVVADNQRPVLEPLARLGVMRLVAPGPLSIASLAAELSPLLVDAELRAGLSTRAQALVDGRGAGRVADHLLNLPDGYLAS